MILHLVCILCFFVGLVPSSKVVSEDRVKETGGVLSLLKGLRFRLPSAKSLIIAASVVVGAIIVLYLWSKISATSSALGGGDGLSVCSKVLLLFGGCFIARLLVTGGALGMAYFTGMSALNMQKLNINVRDGRLEVGIRADVGQSIWPKFLHLETLKPTKITVVARELVPDGPALTLEIPAFEFGPQSSVVDFTTNPVKLELSQKLSLDKLYQEVGAKTEKFTKLCAYKVRIDVFLAGNLYSTAAMVPLEYNGRIPIFSEAVNLAPGAKSSSAERPKGPDIEDFSFALESVARGGVDIFEAAANFTVNLEKFALPVSLGNDADLIKASLSHAPDDGDKPTSLCNLTCSLGKTTHLGKIPVSARFRMEEAQIDGVMTFIQLIAEGRNPLMFLQLGLLGRSLPFKERWKGLEESAKNFDKAKKEGCTAATSYEKVQSLVNVVANIPTAIMGRDQDSMSKYTKLLNADILPIVDNRLAVKLGLPKDKIEKLLGFVKLENLHVWPNFELELRGCEGGNDSCNEATLAVASVRTERSKDSIALLLELNMTDPAMLGKITTRFFSRYSGQNLWDTSLDSASVLRLVPRSDHGENDFYAKLLQYLLYDLKESKDGIKMVRKGIAYGLMKTSAVGAPDESKKVATRKEPFRHSVTAAISDSEDELRLAIDLVLEEKAKLDSNYARISWPDLGLGFHIEGEGTATGNLLALEIKQGSLLLAVSPEHGMSFHKDSSLSMSVVIGGSEKAARELHKERAKKVIDLSHYMMGYFLHLCRFPHRNVLATRKLGAKIVSLMDFVEKDPFKSSTMVLTSTGKELFKMHLPRQLWNAPDTQTDAHSPLSMLMSIAAVNGHEIYPTLSVPEKVLKGRGEGSGNWTMNVRIKMDPFKAGLYLPKGDKLELLLSIRTPKLELEAMVPASGDAKLIKHTTEFDHEIAKSIDKRYASLPLKAAIEVDPIGIVDLMKHSNPDFRIGPLDRDSLLYHTLSTLQQLSVDQISEFSAFFDPKEKMRFARQLQASLRVSSKGDSFAISSAVSLQGNDKEMEKTSSVTFRQEMLDLSIGSDAFKVMLELRDVEIPIPPTAGNLGFKIGLKGKSEVDVGSEDLGKLAENFFHSADQVLSVVTKYIPLQSSSSLIMGKQTFTDSKVLDFRPFSEYLQEYSKHKIIDLGASGRKEPRYDDSIGGNLIKELSIDQVLFENSIMSCPFRTLCPAPEKEGLVKLLKLHLSYSNVVDRLLSMVAAKLRTDLMINLTKVTVSLGIDNPISVRAYLEPERSELFDISVQSFERELVREGSKLSCPDCRLTVGIAADPSSPGLINLLSPIGIPMPPRDVFQRNSLAKWATKMSPKSNDGLQEEAGQPLQLTGPVIAYTMANKSDMLNSIINSVIGKVVVRNLIPYGIEDSADAEAREAKSQVSEAKTALERSSKPAAPGSTGAVKDAEAKRVEKEAPKFQITTEPSDQSNKLVLKLQFPFDSPIAITTGRLRLLVGTQKSERRLPIVGGLFSKEPQIEHTVVSSDMSIDFQPGGKLPKTMTVAMLLENPDVIGEVMNTVLKGERSALLVKIGSWNGNQYSYVSLPLNVGFSGKSIGQILHSIFVNGVFSPPAKPVGPRTTNIPIFLNDPDYFVKWYPETSYFTFNSGPRYSLLPKSLNVILHFVKGQLELNAHEASLNVRLSGVPTSSASAGQLIPLLVKDRLWIGKDSTSAKTEIPAVFDKLPELKKFLTEVTDDQGFIEKFNQPKFKAEVDITNVITFYMKWSALGGQCIITGPGTYLTVMLENNFQMKLPLGGIAIPLGTSAFVNPCRPYICMNTASVRSRAVSGGLDGRILPGFSNWYLKAPVGRNAAITLTSRGHSVKVSASSDELKILVNKNPLKVGDSVIERTGKGIMPDGDALTMAIQYSAYEHRIYIEFTGSDRAGKPCQTVFPLDIDRTFGGFNYHVKINGASDSAIEPTDLRVSLPEFSRTRIVYGTDSPAFHKKPQPVSVYFKIYDGCNRLTHCLLACRITESGSPDEGEGTDTIEVDPVHGIYKCTSSSELPPGSYSLSLKSMTDKDEKWTKAGPNIEHLGIW